MSNVIEFVGAMKPDSHHDRAIRENRSRYVAACTSDCDQGRKPCPTPGACVIDLDSSRLGRLILLAERGWSRLCASVSAASSFFRR